MSSASPPLTPGRLLYLLVHKPLEELARTWREGGPVHQWSNHRGQLAMIAAAAQLPPLPVPSRPAGTGIPQVCFLTGRRFWHQTAFCCWSLRRHASPGPGFQPVFIDDGSFNDALRAECLRVFPDALLRREADLEAHLDNVLPASRFPALRGQRRTYKHLRKLTDAHAGLTGWRVVLDSDMLFFRRPDALLDWQAAPARPVHMLDVHNAYGYPDAVLAALAGRPVPALLNVGICGLRSDRIDWEKLETWCARLLDEHGTSYYLEQALVALLLADADPLRLPAADYRLMPGEAECRSPTAALHHYVAESKRGYFRHAWGTVLAQAGINPARAL